MNHAASMAQEDSSFPPTKVSEQVLPSPAVKVTRPSSPWMVTLPSDEGEAAAGWGQPLPLIWKHFISFGSIFEGTYVEWRNVLCFLYGLGWTFYIFVALGEPAHIGAIGLWVRVGWPWGGQQ